MLNLYLGVVLFLLGTVAYLHYRLSKLSELTEELAKSVFIYGFAIEWLKTHSDLVDEKVGMPKEEEGGPDGK